MWQKYHFISIIYKHLLCLLNKYLIIMIWKRYMKNSLTFFNKFKYTLLILIFECLEIKYSIILTSPSKKFLFSQLTICFAVFIILRAEWHHGRPRDETKYRVTLSRLAVKERCLEQTGKSRGPMRPGTNQVRPNG